MPHHNPVEAGYFLWILLRGFSECFLLVHSPVLPNWDLLPLTQMNLTAWPRAAALLGPGCPRAICDILSIHDFSSVSLRFQVCLAYFAVGSSSKIALWLHSKDAFKICLFRFGTSKHAKSYVLCNIDFDCANNAIKSGSWWFLERLNHHQICLDK